MKFPTCTKRAQLLFNPSYHLFHSTFFSVSCFVTFSLKTDEKETSEKQLMFSKGVFESLHSRKTSPFSGFSSESKTFLDFLRSSNRVFQSSLNCRSRFVVMNSSSNFERRFSLQDLQLITKTIMRVRCIVIPSKGQKDQFCVTWLPEKVPKG